jgi:hypothetical protein
METTPPPVQQSIPSPQLPQIAKPPSHPTNNVLSKVFFFFLGIAIIFFSIAGGIFLYQQHPTKKTSPLAGMLPNTTPGATKENHFPEGYVTQPPGASQGNVITPVGGQTDAQASWRLYQNSSYNFSLSFPSYLTPKEAEYGMGVSSIELRSVDNTDPKYGPDFQFLIFPKTLGSLIGQDFDAYYAMANNATKLIKDQQGASQSFTKIRNRTVSGLRAIDFTTISSPPAANEQLEVGSYIEIGNSVFIISTAESNKATLESMLASFKYPLSQ